MNRRLHRRCEPDYTPVGVVLLLDRRPSGVPERGDPATPEPGIACVRNVGVVDRSFERTLN